MKYVPLAVIMAILGFIVAFTVSSCSAPQPEWVTNKEDKDAIVIIEPEPGIHCYMPKYRLYTFSCVKVN